MKNQSEMPKNKSNYFNLLIRIWLTLKLKRKFQLVFSFLLMIINALAEALLIASVAGLIEFITNSNLDQTKNILLLKPLLFFIPKNPTDSLNIIVIYFIVVVVILTSLRVLNIFINTRLAALIGNDLSNEIFKKNIFQPYLIHTSKKTNSVIVTNTAQVDQAQGVLNLTLNFLTSCFIIVSLSYALVSIDIYLTSLAFTVLSLSYLAIAFTIRKRLYLNSKQISFSRKKQVRLIQEAFGSIRDVILTSSQKYYLEKFNNVEFEKRLRQGESDFFGFFPRYVLEGIGILMLASIPLLVDSSNENSNYIIPALGTFAVGAQRLLPSFQMAYSCWVGIKSSEAPLEDILNSINQIIPKQEYSSIKNRIKIDKKLKLKNIYFKYEKDKEYMIKDINLIISPGENIGIVGSTGSGKSTFIDIFMGLLKPNKGDLFIDNKGLYTSRDPKLLTSWRYSIAHVPQSVYLIDGTIAENVALTSIDKKIDFELVDYVCEIAQISKYIKSLSSNFMTNVGERGIKLSGGQRQRIGIARALYKQAHIIVLDEATSALDNETESKIISSLNKILNEDSIMLSIAHRLSTLKDCDRIIKFDNGLLVSDNFKIDG